MRTIAFVALFLLSLTSFAASFDVKGINLDAKVEEIKPKSITMGYGDSSRYSNRTISTYCNETDKETLDFFSFKGMFFPDFASYRYNTPHNGSGVLTGGETIGGYRIAGIEYDTYKNKVVRLEILIDSHSADSSLQGDADRIMTKALVDKFGKPSGYTPSWRKGSERLIYEGPDEIGYMYIKIQNIKQMATIDAHIKQQCRLHKDDDIRQSAKDI